jgi:virginiamycin B lyase
VFALSGDVGSGGGGQMTLSVNWGDGTTGVLSYTNTTTNFLVGHYYEDDDPSNTPSDLYIITVTLTNTAGSVSTNLGVVVTNVPPRLTLKVNSPIDAGAPATLRGLEITEFALPFRGSAPHGITIGPDNNIWFTETASNRIGRITTNGVITEFPIGGSQKGPKGIATGSDNRLWFCAYNTGQIGAMTTNGVVTMYTIPRLASEPLKSPQYIVRGSGLNMFYTDLSYRIGRVSPTGVFTQYVHQAGVNPWGLALGADNNIWFTAYFSDTVSRLRLPNGPTTSYPLQTLATPTMMTRGPDQAVWFTQLGAGTNVPGKIARITTNGVITETVVGYTGPYGICTGPDGAMWFTEQRRETNSIGRLTPDGQLSRYALATSSYVTEIITGPDSALWFTLSGRDRIGRLRYTTNGNVVLSGELNGPGYLDPGYLDTHFVQINWGDGTPVQTVSLAAGIMGFHVPHTYTGTQPLYFITVGVTDDDGGSGHASTVVVVNAVQFTSITRLGNGDVRLNGVGPTGKLFTIESSTDLQNWSSVGTVNTPTNAFQFIHPGAPGTARFYRGKLP